MRAVSISSHRIYLTLKRALIYPSQTGIHMAKSARYTNKIWTYVISGSPGFISCYE